MEQSFTQNDLIKYIYKETSLTETLEIGAALEEDYNLKEEFKSLMAGYIKLPKATFAPTSITLQNILKYSSQNLVESH